MNPEIANLKQKMGFIKVKSEDLSSPIPSQIQSQKPESSLSYNLRREAEGSSPKLSNQFSCPKFVSLKEIKFNYEIAEKKPKPKKKGSQLEESDKSKRQKSNTGSLLSKYANKKKANLPLGIQSTSNLLKNNSKNNTLFNIHIYQFNQKTPIK